MLGGDPRPRMTESEMAIDEGGKLPKMELVTSDGGTIELPEWAAGKPLVLYFYPKDDTSGCTREAQDFSALMPEFEALGAVVLGVSKDPAAKHQKFISKYDLDGIWMDMPAPIDAQCYCDECLRQIRA